MSPESNLRYQQALTEAHTLLGDQKALKGSVAVCVFRTDFQDSARPDQYFSVRASRAEALKGEGFIEVAQIDLHGKITEIPSQ